MPRSNKVSVKVPRYSGKNLSHRSSLTGSVGTLIPLMVHEPVVGQKGRLAFALDLNLPPLASKTYANIDFKVEAFFVPFRLLMNPSAFEEWFAGYNSTDRSDNIRARMPVIKFGPSTLKLPELGPESLSDYLGNKFNLDEGSGDVEVVKFLALPYLAYHRIYDDWYRRPLVQKSIYSMTDSQGQTPQQIAQTSIYDYFITNHVAGMHDSFVPYEIVYSSKFADGVRLCDLRQRNFGFDYFTMATPSPQLGDAPVISLGDSLSISAIRAANSMQLFKERNVIAGPRYKDAIKGRYGVTVPDTLVQRCQYLGSSSFNVYSNGVFQTAPHSSAIETTNPFDFSVGAEYGSVSCQGQELIFDDFECREPGYIFVMGSLVPRAMYSRGVRRQNVRYMRGPDDVAEMASPLLQNVGNQPIYSFELSATSLPPNINGSIFGYTSRFADWHEIPDEVHGKFQHGQDLSSFLLQRHLLGDVQISTDFLQIPKDYLDQIYAVINSEGFGFG